MKRNQSNIYPKIEIYLRILIYDGILFNYEKKELKIKLEKGTGSEKTIKDFIEILPDITPDGVLKP